jgi:hypothetical protein
MKNKTFFIFGLGLLLVSLSLYSHARRRAPAGGPEVETEPAAQRGNSFLTQKSRSADEDPQPPLSQPSEGRLLDRLIQLQELPKPTVEQLTPYLAANRRSAGSLLAAFRVTSDREWLQEAQGKFPNDPRVAFASVFASESPSERQRWLDALKRNAPDNALPHYLAGLDYFKAGQNEKGLQEIAAAQGKSRFEDYSLDFIQNAQEAYLAAGYSEVEAKAASSFQLLLPQLSQLKQVGRSLSEVVSECRQAGDEAGAQSLLQMGLTLGQRVGSERTFLINDLVGIAIECQMLTAMDPATSYNNGGRTVQERLDELTAVRDEIKATNRQLERLLPNLPESELCAYLDRVRLLGESQASRWLLEKHGHP